MLAVCAQADAVSQLGHGVDVIHPFGIDVLEQHHALKLAHDRRSQRLLLGLIDLMRLFCKRVCQLLRSQVVALLRRKGAVLRPQEHADKRTARPLDHILRDHVVLADRGMHRAADRVVDHAHDVVLDVLALEHLQALRINRLALGVEHVVVFEHVLTGCKVAGLDLLLCILDRA